MAVAPHLGDREFEELLSGNGSNQHLQQCAICRSQFERFHNSLAALRGMADIGAEKTEDFWQRQQTAIRNLLGSPPAPQPLAFPRLAWAAAVVLLVTASLLLSKTPAPPPQARNDADHELLIAVERALQNEGPAALEPATVLTREISQDSSFDSTMPVRKKEKENKDED